MNETTVTVAVLAFFAGLTLRELVEALGRAGDDAMRASRPLKRRPTNLNPPDDVSDAEWYHSAERGRASGDAHGWGCW